METPTPLDFLAEHKAELDLRISHIEDKFDHTNFGKTKQEIVTQFFADQGYWDVKTAEVATAVQKALEAYNG